MNAVLTTFLELCNPSCTSLSSSLSEDDWNSISQLSQRHGLTPYFFYRVKSLGISLPEDINKKWLGSFLYQIAEERKARQQIKELKKVLDPAGIPMILLKGTSAMMRLYPNQGLRTFCDLDILIPADKVVDFREVISKAGYKPSVVLNSPEEEEVWKFESHLAALQKGDGIPIETHLSILAREDGHENAWNKLWKDSEETEIDGVRVNHLNKEHFIIHMLLHFVKHLRTEGNLQMKSLIDVLYAINTWEIDCDILWDQAQRWRVQNEIIPVIATMNHYWHIEIPVTDEVVSLDLSKLIFSVDDQQRIILGRIPGGFISRLVKMKELSDNASRFRYFFHIFFPCRENLYWRYGFSAKRSIRAYYLQHLSVISRRFLTGILLLISGMPKRLGFHVHNGNASSH